MKAPHAARHSEIAEAVGTPDTRARSPFARTLLRGLEILEVVADVPDGLGVTEVAERTSLDKGTTSRLLATLRSMGYVRQDDLDKRYRVGSRALWLAQNFQVTQGRLSALARPYLEELRDATAETVHLAVREGLHIVFVAREEPDRSVRVLSTIGTRLPMYRTAMGRAILAAMSVEERARVVALLRSSGERTDGPDDLATLERDVDEAANRGWAAIEHHDDVTRIAVAITDDRRTPVAALTLSGPSYRMEERVNKLAPFVVSAAAAISRELAGGQGGAEGAVDR